MGSNAPDNDCTKNDSSSAALAMAMLLAMGDPAILLDEQGVITTANPAAADLYAPGKRPFQLTGVPLETLMPAELRESRMKQVQEALLRKKALYFEDEKGGRFYEHRLQPIPPGLKGGIMVMVTRDITFQRMQGIALRREQQRQIFYLESLPGYVLLVRPDHSVHYANRYFRQAFGKPGYKACHDILPGVQGLCPACKPYSFFSDMQPQQWLWRTPEGRVFQVYAHPMTDMDLSPLAMVLGIDVTARTEAENALRHAQRYQKAILDNIPDLVWLKDANNLIVEVNEAFAATFEMQATKIIGLCHEEIFGEEGSIFDERDAQALSGKSRTTYEESFHDSSGKQRWLEVARVPIHDSEGNVLGLTGIARDITERRQAVEMLLYSHAEMEGYVQERTSKLRTAVQQLEAEIAERKRTQEALEAARHKAEAATRAKSVFLANMSHEIRTPLNVIITMADMTLRDESSLPPKRALEMVHDAGRTLLSIINDILDFSKIEASKMHLDQHDFDLRHMIESVWNTHELQARSKGLKTTLHLADDLPPVVKGDRDRLAQVLTNLLGNAVKFTNAGSVVLDVASCSSKDPESVCVTFTVRDTGIGIPEEKQKVIFDSFQQADDATTRQFGGTGLGLSISKLLVNLMGGELSIQSSPDIGSTFRCDLSFKIGDPAALEADRRELKLSRELPFMEPLRILVVEDNPLNRELAGSFLTKQGHTVQEAANGRDALQALKNDIFDIVLMDIQMPQLDGVATTQAIRKTENLLTPASVPVIALTAHAFKEDRQRFFDAGMDGYVAKPIDLALLLQEMQRVLERRPAENAPRNTLTQSDNLEEEHLGGREKALELLQGNMELLKRLDKHFLRDAPKEIENLRAAFEDWDLPLMASLAHNLKGTSATVGASRVSALARKIEAATNGSAAFDLPKLLQSLDAALKTVCEMLENQPEA